jgi:hypothetical protein
LITIIKIYIFRGEDMKIKIFGIIILMLLLTSAMSAVGQNTIVKKQNMGQTLLDDDVPIWNVGDSWTYTINDFTYDYDEGGLKLFFDGNIDDFIWTVADTSGSTYIVDFTAQLSCDFEIQLSSPSTTLIVTGKIRDTLTKMTGTLIFTKSNLYLQDMSAEIRGIVFAKISPIPIALPLPFRATLNADLTTEFPLFDFPLSPNKFWNLPAMDIVANVNAGGIFGLISIPITFTTNYPWIPLAFHCKNKQDISVEAGIFDAWEIESTFFDLFRYYYAPDVGNIVKIDATMINGEVHGELKSTNCV